MVMLCFYVTPLAFGAHPMVMVAYAMLNTTAMVITHSGYDIRFYPGGRCRLTSPTNCTIPETTDQSVGGDEFRRQVLRNLQADDRFR